MALSRIQRTWYFLEQQRRNARLRQQQPPVEPVLSFPDFTYDSTQIAKSPDAPNAWYETGNPAFASAGSKMPSDGYLERISLAGSINETVVLGLDTNGTASSYDDGSNHSSWAYGFYVYMGQVNIFDGVGTSSIDNVAAKVDGIYRLARVGNQIKLRLSTDGGTTFTDIYTYTTLISGDLYPKIAIAIAGHYITGVNGFGLVDRPVVPVVDGIIYEKSSWSNLSDFIDNNTNAAIVGDKIRISGAFSANGFDRHLLIKNKYSQLPHWKATTVYKVLSNGNQDYGAGIGKFATNPFRSGEDSVILLSRYESYDDGANGSGKLCINKGGASDHVGANNVVSDSRLIPQIGDLAEVSVEYNNGQVDGKVIVTRGGTVIATLSKSFYIGTNTDTRPTSGLFGIWSFAGLNEIQSIKIENLTQYDCDDAFVGDSKTQCYTASVEAMTYVAQYAAANPTRKVINLDAGYDRTSDVILRLPEIIKLRPKRVILNIGSNGRRTGVDFNTWKANYQSIVTSLKNAGIVVSHLLQLYETGLDFTDYNNYINATYPGDIRIATSLTSGDLVSDGVHPNDGGMTKIASACIITLNVIDNSEVKVALFGDSMSALQTATTNRFESFGYMPQLNAVTGQRYTFNHGLNFGVSGEKTSDMAARVASVVSSCVAQGVKVVIFLSGANDRTAKQAPSVSISNLNTIVNAFRAAGIKILILTSLPRRDAHYTTNGFTAPEIVQAKADTVTYNNAIKALAASDLWVADTYSAWVDTDGQCKVGLTTDDLHHNAAGGFLCMQQIEAIMTPKYGIRQFTLSANNKLANTNFAGTGGTVSSATGQLANNHLTIGTQPTGTASRTFSKALGQVMSFAFPSAGTNTDNFRCLQRYTSSAETGKQAYYEVELRILNSGSGAGIWRTLSAELSTSAGSLSIGFDRAGTSDPMALDRFAAFLAAKGRTLLLRTPTLPLPTATYIEGRVNIEANTIGGALSGSIELLNEQLVIV